MPEQITCLIVDDHEVVREGLRLSLSRAPHIRVVGEAGAGRATPLFEDEMRYIIFRPYWVIPPGILARETLPAVRRDGEYLARNDMELFRGDGDNGAAVPATAANLARVASGTLGIRQRPGPRTPAGRGPASAPGRAGSRGSPGSAG